MSDISIPTAPAGDNSAPPPPPQSSQTEVRIPDQSPTGANGEIGQQTPDKSPEQREHERNTARRASVEKAFAKARTAAESKESSESKDQDAKGKTPGEDRGKPEAKAQEERVRGERGRFAPRDAQEGAKDGAQSTPKYAPLAEDAPYRDPPPRFSEPAKKEWAAVPESVRGAIYTAHQEMQNGIRHYQQQAEAFNHIRDYHELAQKGGTNLRTALDNYWGIEKKLRSDLLGGIDLIINNLNRPGPNGGRYNVYDFARDVLQLTPDQHRLTQQQNVTQAQNHRMGQLYQTVEKLAAGFHQMQYRQQFTWTRSQIDQFADSHPGFDERSDIIKQELDHGYPLDEAYRRAIRLRPLNGNGATRAAQTRNTSAQTRSEETDRSISGAPNGGAASLRDTPKKKVSSREAIGNAMRRIRTGA